MIIGEEQVLWPLAVVHFDGILQIVNNQLVTHICFRIVYISSQS